ncbi:MAG: phosphatidylserine decarboxylase [Clostridia bacterium]|nr:phosphatidylserine decarboxylase [Clostridia bacterium]
MVKWLLMILLGMILSGMALLFFLRRIWFYRDPTRVPPEGENLIVAPADGKIVYIRPFNKGEVISEKLGRPIPITEITRGPAWGESGWLIGIYMSPLDVHFNYAPLAGKIVDIIHTPAAVNLPMVDLWEYIRLTYLRQVVDLFSHRYRLVNERLTLFLSHEHLNVALVEIADKFVNKISCFVRPGQEVAMGHKLSFIERGSQVDLIIFSQELEFLVKVGQQVYGARTPICRYFPGDREKK